MSLTNPREACLQALGRWEESIQFAHEILHETVSGSRFTMLDRAFLTEMFYGVLRNLSLLDFLISKLRDDPLDTGTRRVLRLGLYQIFKMRIPHHAAVNETVNLAGRARGLVNAMLRRCIREHEELSRKVDAAPASVRYSHPELLIGRWRSHFGAAEAEQICEWNNEPAEVFVRVNTLKATRSELVRAVKDVEVFEAHPLVIKVKQIPPIWIVNGLCYVQDPSTLMACEMLDPQPGERILDACAAPGGKTSYVAQLMQNTGEIVACDASAARLERLHENLERLSVTNTKVAQVDWLSQSALFEPGSFDRILVDAPCSNTGVIRRRIDVRWRLTSEDFSKMQEKQVALVKRVFPLLREGGVLVYSSCSMEPEEDEHVVARILAELPELRLLESRQTFPFRDRVDGAFAAKFERCGKQENCGKLLSPDPGMG